MSIVNLMPRRAATVAVTVLLALPLSLPTQAADPNPRTGACAGKVTLQQPRPVELYGHAVVGGQAPELDPADNPNPDTATVTIKIRKRNTSAYVEVGRIYSRNLPADGRGGFAYDLGALRDDHAVMASTKDCDSNIVIAKIKPTVTGPVRVRRGSRVTLTVRGVPNAPVKIAFHRAGVAEDYVVRRTGMTDDTGFYRATYIANVDQSYYALVSNGQRRSAVGATVVY